MPEMAPSGPFEHDCGQTRSNRYSAAAAGAEGACSVTAAEFTRLSFDQDHDHDLCMNVTFLASDLSKDGLEGAILGMRHRRMCGDTPRKFQPLSLWKSH